MRKQVVVMSWVEQDREEEKTAGIDAGWTRLSDVLKGKNKLKHEVRLNYKQTDETAMLCYSSGTSLLLSLFSSLSPIPPSLSSLPSFSPILPFSSFLPSFLPSSFPPSLLAFPPSLLPSLSRNFSLPLPSPSPLPAR